MNLPTHVATDDEPIPALIGREWDGPDMRAVAPIGEMLADLRQFTDDEVGYVELWREFIASVGGWASMNYDHDGTRHLGIGRPCDAQTRHRSRWIHFLTLDLHDDPSHYEHLASVLEREGHYADNRPPNPRQTTVAIRDFVRTGGRILLEPDGNITEGAWDPRHFLQGEEEAEECLRAGRSYYEVRRRWRSERQIKRAVRMLGHRTSNGWWVLEAPSRKHVAG